MTPERAIDLIVAELRRAEKKHPGWPVDRLRQVCIISEEAGEVMRGALTIVESEEHLMTHPQEGYEVTLAHHRMAALEEELMAEVVQTAAMSLRWLLNWKPLYAQDRPEPRS